MACDPQTLVSAAVCNECSLPPGMQLSAAIAVAAQIAGVSADPQSLVNSSVCLLCGLPVGLQWSIVLNLACQIRDGQGIVTPTDPDVAAFITCSGITDATQIGAVTTLVASLKAANLWTSFDAIYPFVGGTAQADSCNLKNPVLYSITWHGGVTHNAMGVTGNGTTGYGDTQFNPSTAGGNYALNSAALGAYVTSYTGTGELLMGAITGGNPAIRLEVIGNGGTPSVIICVNDANPLNGITGTGAADIRGLNVGVRTSATSTTAYAGSGVSQTFAGDNSTSLPNLNVFVLAESQGGVPFNFISATVSFAFFSSALSAGQVATLQGIVTTYETTLGRQ